MRQEKNFSKPTSQKERSMAKYRPIYLLIWNDPWFEELRPYEKLMFVFLFGNEATNESGIYPCTFKTISKQTDIPIGIVEKAVKEDLADKLVYDEKNKVMWVKNFLKHNGKGNQAIIFRSILNDHKTVKTPLWDEFWAYNRDLLAEYILKYKPLRNDIESSKLELPGRLTEELGNSNLTLTLELPKSKVTLTKEIGNSNQRVTKEKLTLKNEDTEIIDDLTLTEELGNSNSNSPPITIPITITNSSITKKDNISLADESDAKIPIDDAISAIIEQSNVLFPRDGFKINPDDFNARNMIGLRINEFGIKTVSTAIKQAEKVYYHSSKMFRMCHWEKLFRDTTIKDLFTQSQLEEPGDTKVCQKEQTAEQKMEDHQKEKEIEHAENERYQLASQEQKIDIVFEIIKENINEMGPYQLIIRDDENKKEVNKRIRDFILTNETERSTVMIGVSGIITDFLEELDKEDQ
jgi:hypothetical protein